MRPLTIRGRRSIVLPPVAKPTGWTPKLRTTRKRTPPELQWRPEQQAQQITTQVDLDTDEESLESWGAPTPRRLVPPVIEHTPEKSESHGVVDDIAKESALIFEIFRAHPGVHQVRHE